jgi:UDP-N-acetylglucosamine--N-acetylmuramyl-(pentapeptide) pyrophosphoryl-undecaprenol N-acetylglucosamine transferase
VARFLTGAASSPPVAGATYNRDARPRVTTTESRVNAPTFLFTGGGSGGHLFPGIAVAEELRRREPAARIVFVGSQREVERRIVEAHGLEHRTLPVEPSTALWRNPFRFAWRYWRATLEARRLLDELGPRIVVGLGGFASVPVVREAFAARVPIVLLEQNAVPGRATRWLAKRASAICTSFEETPDLPLRAVVETTGNPVRGAIAALHEIDGPEPTPDRRRVLLVLGGSQGAVAVNDVVLAVTAALGRSLAEWRIVHQTGEADAERVRSAYERVGLDAVVEPFFEDLVPWYRTASLAIARAGATTLAELACAGVPAVLIPYAGAIHDHQTRNAELFHRAGAALHVPQGEIEATARLVLGTIQPLLLDPEQLESRRRAMQALAWPDAAARVADVIERVRWR